MAYKRKYEKGEPITSLDELMDREFIYWRNKITHKGWFMSWPLRLVHLAISNGILFRASKITKEDD